MSKSNETSNKGSRSENDDNESKSAGSKSGSGAKMGR